MKNSFSFLVFIGLLLGITILLVFVLQNSKLNERVKIVVLDIFLIIISVKYRRYARLDLMENLLYVIRWYALNFIIILLTIGFFIYDKP